MSDDATQQNDSVVYATMTVDTSGDVTDDELGDMFPDADHVKAHHRVTGNILGEIGDKPTNYVCPKCGEGVHSKRDINETSYYRHYDNKNCKRDVRDAREQKRKQNRPARWRRALSAVLGAGISIAIIAAVMESMPAREMTMNGEPVMIPPSGLENYVTVGLILVLAILIMWAVRVMPRMGVGGRLR